MNEKRNGADPPPIGPHEIHAIPLRAAALMEPLCCATSGFLYNPGVRIRTR